MNMQKNSNTIYDGKMPSKAPHKNYFYENNLNEIIT